MTPRDHITNLARVTLANMLLVAARTLIRTADRAASCAVELRGHIEPAAEPAEQPPTVVIHCATGPITLCGISTRGVEWSQPPTFARMAGGLHPRYVACERCKLRTSTVDAPRAKLIVKDGAP